MDDESKKRAAHAYMHLAQSFGAGLARFHGARVLSLSARIAVLRYHMQPRGDHSGHPHSDVLDLIHAIDPRAYDNYDYVTNVTHLVYATTLLDTFLTDTTKFLLILFPRALGKNQSVSLHAVLGATSRSELVNQAVARKVREISYLPFLARIEYLRETFGLTISLNDTVVQQLEHYSTLRNVVVHDQGIWDSYLDVNDRLQVRAKTCPVHPTPVPSEELMPAIRAYTAVVRQIFAAVIDQVFGAINEPEVRALLRRFDDRDRDQSPGSDAPAA